MDEDGITQLVDVTDMSFGESGEDANPSQPVQEDENEDKVDYEQLRKEMKARIELVHRDRGLTEDDPGSDKSSKQIMISDGVNGSEDAGPELVELSDLNHSDASVRQSDLDIIEVDDDDLNISNEDDDDEITLSEIDTDILPASSQKSKSTQKGKVAKLIEKELL